MTESDFAALECVGMDREEIWLMDADMYIATIRCQFEKNFSGLRPTEGLRLRRVYELKDPVVDWEFLAQPDGIWRDMLC